VSKYRRQGRLHELEVRLQKGTAHGGDIENRLPSLDSECPEYSDDVHVDLDATGT